MIASNKHWTYVDARYLNGGARNSTMTFDDSNYDLSDFIIPQANYPMNNKQKSNTFGINKQRITNKEEVVIQIKNVAKYNRKLLNHKTLIKQGYGNIVSAALKFYGTWHKAILASGEQPLYKKWNKSKVIYEIMKMNQQTGKVPNFGELKRSGDTSLINAARIYWGRWTNAIKAASSKPYRNDYWTKETLIVELRSEVEALGKVPSKRELHKYGRYDLVSSGTKFFKGYNNYLIAAGYQPVLIPNIWTKERIIKEVFELFNVLRRTPTERDMIAYGMASIKTAANKQFGSWNKTVVAAGLKPNESFVTDKTWKEWESLALCICQKIYPCGQKHKIFVNKTIPDFFIARNKKIIEIKLNSSDTTIFQDVRKYSGNCNSIEIWYLVGRPVRVLSNNLKFVGPNKIRDLIINMKDEDLLERYDKLRKKIKSKRLKYVKK